MADPSVTLMTDRANAPRLSQTGEGYAGSRVYRVATHDEVRALGAPGVPRLGDAWGDGLSALTCWQRAVEYAYGTDDAGLRTGGRCLVRCDYRTPTGRAAAEVAAAAGVAYTEWLGSVETVNVLFAPRAPGFVGPPDPRPLANGQGATIEVGSFIAKVHTFKPIVEAVPIADLVDLAGSTNLNAVTLPPLLGQSQTLVLAPGQALYRYATFAAQGAVIETVHELKVATDFIFRWRLEDAQGRAIGDGEEAVVYREVNFPAFV